MAEKLQSLLDKINEKGVKEAETAAAGIIAAAEKDAASIREKAEAEAAAIIEKARLEALSLEERSGEIIRQAARDVLLELRKELEVRISRAVAGVTVQAMTPEFMAGLIREFAMKLAADPSGQVTVLSAVKDVPALEKTLKSTLANSFRSNPKVLADKELRGGFEVSFKDGDVFFDFSGDAVAGLVGDYIGPRLAEILKGE